MPPKRYAQSRDGSCERNRHRRRRGRGRGGAGRSQDQGERSSERHPSHLKGKQIGLFYARRNRKNRELNGDQVKMKRPLGSVLLSTAKKEHIQSILDSNAYKKLFTKSSNTYENVEDSVFKREFMRVINESLEDKLQFAEKNINRDQNLDEILYQQHQDKQTKNRYIQMINKRKSLPSFKMKNEILDVINSNQISVISGETGCGKTTQVAQFILDDYIENKKGSTCRIICTQPRRISAISVAERVADERNENLGVSVGYQIRLEKRSPRDKGSIMFCTTGIVLKLMESNAALSGISHLILDEIHERDIMSDFILALIKKIITYRKDIKIILMSATLNSEKFSKYYNNAPHLNIPGFTFPVQEFYLEDVLQRTNFVFPQVDNRRKASADAQKEYTEFIAPHVRLLESQKTYSRNVCIQLYNPNSEKLNLQLILALIINIIEKEKDKGAILVFLTGFLEISNLNQLLNDSGKFPTSRFLIFPLHSLMPTIDQKQIFEAPPSGVRKIILATNIAETSITIDDVVYVIDSGRIKMSNFDVKTNSKTLAPEWVSLANANQRKGRAGRVKPGMCFHLYSKAREMILEQYQKPEILRSRLEDVILTLKVLQLGKVESFFGQLIDSPDPESVAVSLELLKRLEALTDDEALTPLGFHLAKLPMAPQLGKMILYGAIFSCIDPILSVAATLDFKDPFQLPIGKEDEVRRRKNDLSLGLQSDHLMFHNVMKLYEESGNTRQFCWYNFLSQPTLKLLVNMKQQFMEYLFEMKFVPNSNPNTVECNQNSNNISLIKAIICAGLYPNVAISKVFGKIPRFSPDGRRMEIHPKSILGEERYVNSNILVFYEKVKSTSDFIYDASLVHPLPIIFFGDNFAEEMENGRNFIYINKKLKFKCTESTSRIIKEMKNRFCWFLEYKISHPGPIIWGEDNDADKILEMIMELITCEDMGMLSDDAYEDSDN